jgi:hypothetical protein
VAALPGLPVDCDVWLIVAGTPVDWEVWLIVAGLPVVWEVVLIVAGLLLDWVVLIVAGLPVVWEVVLIVAGLLLDWVVLIVAGRPVLPGLIPTDGDERMGEPPELSASTPGAHEAQAPARTQAWLFALSAQHCFGFRFFLACSRWARIAHVA